MFFKTHDFGVLFESRIDDFERVLFFKFLFFEKSETVLGRF